MEGTGNLIENRFPLSFPLGLVFGWGAPYSFFLFFFFPSEVFLKNYFLLSLKNSQ